MDFGQEPLTDTLLFDRLSSIIQHQLNKHRKLYKLEPVTRRADYETVKVTISEDFRPGNAELKAWCYLYHRYVRVDLDLNVEDLVAFTSEDRRTLQRRQSHALHRLTEALNRRENRLRLQFRKAVQRATLIFPVAPKIIGQVQLIEAALQRLDSDDLPSQLLLYGPAGIGKTTLALAIAHRLIDMAYLNAVIWLDVAQIGLERLHTSIVRELNVPMGGMPLAVYVQDNDLIVLDNADALLEDESAYSSLLRELGRARLLMCSTSLGQSALVVPRLPMLELEEADALTFMATLAQALKTRSPDDVEYFGELYNRLGGNPGALRAALESRVGFHAISIAGGVYNAAWEQIAEHARLIWVLLALSPKSSQPVQALAELMSGTTDEFEQAREELIGAAALEATSDRIQLVRLAAEFAEGIIREPGNQALVQMAIRKLTDRLSVDPDLGGSLRVLEGMEAANLPDQVQLDVVYTFATVIQRGGAWVAWVRVLECLKPTAAVTDQLWIGLRLGFARRWLAQWHAAAYTLADVIDTAGRIGLFDVQAEAMLELAAVHRYQRDNQAAAALIQRAESYYRRLSSGEGLAHASAEGVLLALANGDLNSAQELLDVLSVYENRVTARGMSLAAQLDYQRGAFDTALSHALAAQNEQVGDVPRQGRTSALLGQIYHRLGNRSAAIDQLLGGMRLMEQTGDRYGYARARMNVAAVYIAHGNLRTALHYLRDLPAEFEKLDDVESLQATLSNLDRLNQAAHNWKRRSA